MGITRSLRGVGIGHTEGEGSRLHELPEVVKFLELAIIRTHGGRREPDPTLGCAYETTDRRERATVADSRNHPCVEDRPVGETVDTLWEVFQDARGDIVSAAHDNISPERGDEGVIGLGRIGDDRQPLGLSQLHDIAAVCAGSPGHRERLPCRKSEQVERLTGRESVHRQRAGLDVRGVGRCRNHCSRIKDDLFAVGTVAALRDHHGHDRVPNLHTSGDTVTDLVRLLTADAGNEDGVLKDALYREVMGVFLRRIQERKRLPSS